MRKIPIPSLLICLAPLLPAVVAGFAHPHRPAWKDITGPDEVNVETTRQWGGRVLWIDARSRAEFEAGHASGAILLNEDHFDDLLLGVVDRWTPDSAVVVYCSSRRCHSSEAVAQRLRREMGWTNVHVLTGKCDAWREVAR